MHAYIYTHIYEFPSPAASYSSEQVEYLVNIHGITSFG